jgi:hypothetical protein
MKIQTESDGRLWLRKLLEQSGNICQPIETSTALGVPDIFVASSVGDAWCELKMGFEAGVFVKVKWRPLQRRWLQRYHEVRPGACSLLFVFLNQDVAIFKNANIMEQYSVRAFFELASLYDSVDKVRVNDVLSIIDKSLIIEAL